MDTSRKRALIGVVVGHAAHDTWFGVAPVLLAALSSSLGLSNADIGLVLLIYQSVSSLTQPFFGRLSDAKHAWMGGRTMAVVAILWTTALFGGVILAPSKIFLFLFIGLAGFGSGAFHPQGAANATLAGGERWGATAASLFFFGGMVGTAFLGSALGGWLLGTYGRPALLLLALITVGLALTVVRACVPRHIERPARGHPNPGQTLNSASPPLRGGVFWALLGILLLGTALRALTQQSLGNYVPKQLDDLGVPTATYGLVMSLFLFGNAIGGVIGSYLADRVGLLRVLIGSLILAGVALYGYLNLEGVPAYASLVCTGLFIGPSHTLFMVAGQRQFPQRMAMVSGVFLGFVFISGGIGAWLLGLAADRIGLGAALSVLPWSLWAGAICALVAVPRGVARQAPQRSESVAAESSG